MCSVFYIYTLIYRNWIGFTSIYISKKCFFCNIWFGYGLYIIVNSLENQKLISFDIVLESNFLVSLL